MPAAASLAVSLALLPEPERSKAWASLTEAEAAALEFDWHFWARPDQLAPPGNWRTWLILAGRGWGKSRTGAEWAREQVGKGAKRLALVAATAADVRDVIVEGESGVLAICPPDARPLYEPSKRRLTWPNGAIATTYSADEPERLRGPQHDAAWCDELAAWRYPEAWDMLQFGLRLGSDPRVVVTTTPRPLPHVRELIKSPTTVVTRGRTYDNRANLAPAFFSEIITKYEGTRLGRQELEAELLEEAEGALWTAAMIEASRQRVAPELKRVVVAIDPAVTATELSDETGLVVAGVGDCRCKCKLPSDRPERHAFVLQDASGKHSPDVWARKAVELYQRHEADRIVAEVNNGGDLVENTIRSVSRTVPYTAVRAAKGKRTRAEPVAALYEQGKVHHVGSFPKLEDQMVTWEPLSGMQSPDRIDALVWALTELIVDNAGPAQVREGSLFDL